MAKHRRTQMNNKLGCSDIKVTAKHNTTTDKTLVVFWKSLFYSANIRHGTTDITSQWNYHLMQDDALVLNSGFRF